MSRHVNCGCCGRELPSRTDEDGLVSSSGFVLSSTSANLIGNEIGNVAWPIDDSGAVGEEWFLCGECEQKAVGGIRRMFEEYRR